MMGKGNKQALRKDPALSCERRHVYESVYKPQAEGPFHDRKGPVTW
jgi:hypothetical protein